MSMQEKKPAQPNQSIIDSMTLLQAVVASNDPVGCTQLAREYHLDVTRVNRILGTLAYLGVLKRTRSRKYVPGSGIHVLAAMSMRGSQLFSCALPHIRTLERKTKMMAMIGLLWRTRVSFVHFRPMGQALNAVSSESALLPAHEAGAGRILLAQYTNDQVRKQFKDFGGDDSVDMDELLGMLDRIREKGFATGTGFDSAAVAIGDPAIAALAVTSRGRDKVPIPPKKIPAIVEILHDTAAAIAADMADKRAR